MTTYNAKDLIEQAQMLADLQNSDFISWKENMMFLDNAWADLYQQIINHGDKSFLKTFSFEGERCELPRDFYQLQYVCYNDGLNEVPINRKAKTSLTGGPFYDLVEDEIVIYNRMNSLRKVSVYYYPVRDSITYAADDQKVGAIDGDIIDVCDKNVLYKEGNNYFVKDIINGTESNATRGFMLTDNGVISDTTKSWFKKDNKAYYAEWSSRTLTLKKANGTVLHTVKVTTNPNFPTQKINAFYNNQLVYVKNGKLESFDLETGTVETIAEDLTSDKVYSFKDDLYWETKDGITVNGEVLVPTTHYDAYHGVMKEDEKTGYGLLFDNLVIKSVYENTELLFPNNVYYNYLAYKLAVYYKIKQNADPSGMMAMAEKALNVFYDTILKDTNDFVRISNVYAR
jgi:hypothetical protein